MRIKANLVIRIKANLVINTNIRSFRSFHCPFAQVGHIIFDATISNIRYLALTPTIDQ
jgi:hypothetical protein